jgi:hypothetical protein
MSHPMRRNGETTITQALRNAMSGPKPIGIFDLWERVETDVHRVMSRAQIEALLAQMMNRGEVKAEGRSDERTYRLVSK